MVQPIDNVKMISFQQRGDERGDLIVAEGDGMDIPFDIKRVFYIYGSDSEVVRGSHANRETEFLLVNVSGTSKVRLADGSKEIIVELNKPRMGLYISSMVWKDMYDFSKDSVLLVLASRHYDANEYIRDFDEYLSEIQKGKK